MGRPRKYQTEEERKAAHREANRRYYQANKEKVAEYYQNNKEKIDGYFAEYYQNNKEYFAEYWAKYRQKYRQTPEGRARILLDGYKKSDNLYDRGECTLTPEWIIENVFSQPCHYCGKTDWAKMGCDRIDNSLPHTPDNVVPCCYHCNCKKHTTPYDEYMKMIGKIA